MKTILSLTAPTLWLLIGLPTTHALAADEPANSRPSSTTTVTPGVPVTPGRPHASSFDPHDKLDPDTQIQIALQHKAEGRPQEAINTLTLAVSKYPDHARLHSVRGSLLLEQGRVAQALADLEKAIALDPNDAETLTNRAQAYREFGRVDEATNDLDRAVEINPNLIAARFNRGAIRYGMRDFPGSLEDFNQCIDLDPHLPAPYFNRAAVHDALGDRQAGIADLERFLQIAQNDAWKAQAQQLLEIWTNPEKEKAVAKPAQPKPH